MVLSSFFFFFYLSLSSDEHSCVFYPRRIPTIRLCSELVLEFKMTSQYLIAKLDTIFFFFRIVKPGSEFTVSSQGLGFKLGLQNLGLSFVLV